MIQSMLSSFIILAGAVVMLASIIKSKALLDAAPLIIRSHRQPIVRLLKLHRAFMVVFLVGYIGVAAAFLFQLRFFGELFVSIIFLMGAAFVLMGILIQSRMLAEIQSTFQGIVPICSRCRKVRHPESQPEDRGAWRDMEAYLTDSSEVALSPGFCPDCMDQLYGLPNAS